MSRSPLIFTPTSDFSEAHMPSIELDKSQGIIDLADAMIYLSSQPENDGSETPVQALERVMYEFVGDPDVSNRLGHHEMPGVYHRPLGEADERTYSIGYTASFFVNRSAKDSNHAVSAAELVVVRRAPDSRVGDSNGIMVVKHDLLSGKTSIPDTHTWKQEEVDGQLHHTVDIDPDRYDRSAYRLEFSTELNGDPIEEPVQQTTPKYYTHSNSPDPYYHWEYSHDIGELVKVLEQRQAVERSANRFILQASFAFSD